MFGARNYRASLVLSEDRIAAQASAKSNPSFAG